MKTLKEYLEATLSGNSSAFTEVISRFHGMALKTAYNRLGDVFFAEDAVQEAFLTAYMNLPSLRNLESFSSWFRAILFSCCEKLRKKNKLDIHFIDFNELKNISTSLPSPLEVLELREAIYILNAAVAILPVKNKEVSLLFYLHGFSQKEIADMLVLPTGTVKRRLHEAREHIINYFRQRKINPRTIRVGYMPISDHLLAMISHYYNDDTNIRIELHKFLSWSSLSKAIASRLVDAAFIMAPLAMALKSEGIPITYILDAHHNGSAITFRKPVSNAKTLVGKRICLPTAISTHHTLLFHFLQEYAMSIKNDVFINYLNPSYTVRALKEDRIDGFFCAEPWHTKSVKNHIGQIFLRSNDIVPGHICCLLVVSRDFAAKQGDIIRIYLKKLFLARDHIRKDPSLSAKIQAHYTGIKPEIAEYVIKNRFVTFDDLIPDKERTKKYMNMALNAGTLQKPCDIDNFISSDYL